MISLLLNYKFTKYWIAVANCDHQEMASVDMISLINVRTSTDGSQLGKKWCMVNFRPNCTNRHIHPITNN